ncbi:hypothetical protein SEPCBS57363_003171 [Sporothrix epigloea]|uniref:Snf2 family helicase n=1 Tax=Sporothrix epigloea TaxID=1892477 RepID=A0ABP0DP74_9PEZI
MSCCGSTDDPFAWSNERLVKELCTPQRSWPAPPPKKWPEPDLFAAMLQQHDLNGQDLLCFEDIMGQGGFELLCTDLGVTKIPHKISLRIAIRLLQKRSLQYRAWKEAQMVTDPVQEEPQDVTSSSQRVRPAVNGEHREIATTASNESGFVPIPAFEPVSNNVNRDKDATKDKPNCRNTGLIKGTTNGDTFSVATSSETLPVSSSLPITRSKKRKRIVPTTVPSTITHKARYLNLLDDTLELGRDYAGGAYLGGWALTEYALLQGSDPLEPTNDDQQDTDEFSWAHPMPVPPGRRLQVYRILCRHLQPASPILANLGRTHQRPKNGLSFGPQYEDNNEVLPALGESDDEGYDTETWEAMEQEANERNEKKTRKNRPLTVETVDAVIAEAIRDIEAKWTDRKLPKLRRREYRMWTAARNSGSRKFLLNKALKEADQYEQRIKKLVNEMRQVEWRTEKEVRMQAIVLDASIEDKQQALWESRLYSSTSAPTKPVGGKVLAWRRSLAPRVRPGLDDNEEFLTSSSSDDDGGGVAQDTTAHGEDGGEIYSSDFSMDISDDGMDRSDKVDQMALDTPKSYSQPDRALVRPPSFQKTRSAITLAAEFPLEDHAAIIERGVSFWEAAGDVTRLLYTVFSNTSRKQLARLFQILSLNVDELWQKYCVPAFKILPDKIDPRNGNKPEDDATAFTRFFYIFLTVRHVAPQKFSPRDDSVQRKVLEGRGALGSFCVKLRTLAPYFNRSAAQSKQPKSATKKKKIKTATDPVDANLVNIASNRNDENDSEAHKDPEAAHQDEKIEGGDSTDVPISQSFLRRGRLVTRDQGAQSLRDRDKARQVEQENRRKVHYQSLAQTGQLTHNQTRLIINEAKDEHHGFVYVDSWIGQNIRDHQVDGVRFMWNQIIAPSESRQGCLLAHTMGLGKTMQVITLLVAIADAAKSRDKSISEQIPLDLRASKTLILCPAGLVENWQDELLIWSQTSSLGLRYSITASMDPESRILELQKWAKSGGTMVVGYDMVKRLDKGFGRDAMSLLETTPNIVIADEAHTLKNPASQIHQLTQNFRTSARIAMTGSPLANSVSEYHSMINWVAPNYLAARDEFNATYANPIKEGFYRDSTMSQRRHAYKMLKVLKDTVAPKIHRITISNLQGVLPEKREFILYLPLTPLQMSVYYTFIKLIKQPRIIDGIQNTVQLWNLLVNLTLLLGHPKIFRDRLLEMKLVGADTAVKGLRTGLLPLHVIDDLLTAVGVPGMEKLETSSKMVVLMGILDEAKRVGEKVLVFSQSKLVLDFLEAEFKRQNRVFRRLDGDTSVNKRQDMVKEFNTGADEVYLISTAAGGLGLNIQGANRVVIFDFKWNPMYEQQAIGRAYRIGQMCKVFVYWLIVGETFETVLHDQAVFKTQLASRVVDKKNPLAWSNQLRNYTKDPSVMLPDPSLAMRFESRDPVLDSLLRNGTAAQPCICKIVSTDTFEQEEPEVKLSPEDLSDAANMVNLNKMRKNLVRDEAASDVFGSRRFLQAATAGPPVERTQIDGSGFPPALAPVRPPTAQLVAQHVPQLQQLPQHAQQLTPRPLPQPTSKPVSQPASKPVSQPASKPVSQPASKPVTQPTSKPVSQPASKPAPGPASKPVPRPLPQSVPQPGAQPVVLPVVQRVPQPLTQPALQKPLPPPPPMQIPTIAVENSGNNLINLTQAKTAEKAVEKDPLFLDPVPETPAAAPLHDASTSLSSSLAGSPEELIRLLKQTLLSGQISTQRKPSPQTANMMARKAVQDIVQTLRLAGVPAQAQWGRLRALVLNEPLLIEMIVYGAIAPVQLATMSGSEEMAFVSHVLFAVSEMRSVGVDGVYNVQNTPHCCGLFGSMETLERVVERKLYEGVTSFTHATGDALSSIMAGELVARIYKTLPNGPITKTVLARYAIRAFRDPLFVNALLSGEIDFKTWPLAPVSEQVAFVRRLHDKHSASRPSQATGNAQGSAASSNGAAAAANADHRNFTKSEPPENLASASTLNRTSTYPGPAAKSHGISGEAGGAGRSRRVKSPNVARRLLQKIENERIDAATNKADTMSGATKQPSRAGDNIRNPFVLED